MLRCRNSRQRFLGTVARTADAIDPATRTLNRSGCSNKDGKLLPVHSARCILRMDFRSRITIPVNAMLFRAEAAGRGRRQGQHSAFASDQHWTRFRQYAGNSWRLDVSDQIIINPSDSLDEGQKVRVAKASSEILTRKARGSPRRHESRRKASS